MSNTLRSAIDQLAANFAASIVAAVRARKLDDILALTDGAAPTARPGARSKAPASRAAPAPAPRAPAAAKRVAKDAGRLHRRSPEELAKALGKVVAVLEENKGGLRSEQIQKRLGMVPKEMPRVLKLGLEKKVLKSKGEKRSTVYRVA